MPPIPLCQACGKPVAATYVQALGGAWHPGCWRCGLCERPLEGPFVARGGRGYHPDCHTEKFGPRCSVCHEVIRGNYYQHEGRTVCERDFRERFAPRCFYCGEALEGTFKVNAHGQKACARHDHGRVCSTCGRWLAPREDLLAPAAPFGTALCEGCGREPVGPREAAAYGNAFGAEALRGAGQEWGAMPPVPIRLATAAELRQLKGPLDDAMEGFTQTEVTSLQGTRLRTIRGVVVVGGLAKEHFEGVLAHEFGHAWLFGRGVEGCAAPLVEGFCELVRHQWLTRLGTPLALELRRRLEENPDPVYGDGFRLVKARWEAAGPAGVKALLGLQGP